MKLDSLYWLFIMEKKKEVSTLETGRVFLTGDGMQLDTRQWTGQYVDNSVPGVVRGERPSSSDCDRGADCDRGVDCGRGADCVRAGSRGPRGECVEFSNTTEVQWFLHACLTIQMIYQILNGIYGIRHK